MKSLFALSSFPFFLLLVVKYFLLFLFFVFSFGGNRVFLKLLGCHCNMSLSKAMSYSVVLYLIIRLCHSILDNHLSLGICSLENFLELFNCSLFIIHKMLWFLLFNFYFTLMSCLDDTDC